MFAYITASDNNWLKGFEYFIDEWQLNYDLQHYITLDALLQESEEIKKNILVVILDWELSKNGYFKQEAFEKLEKDFPFIPIIAFSDVEFPGSQQASYFINKKTLDPVETFNTIMTYM